MWLEFFVVLRQTVSEHVPLYLSPYTLVLECISQSCDLRHLHAHLHLLAICLKHFQEPFWNSSEEEKMVILSISIVKLDFKFGNGLKFIRAKSNE